MPKGLPAALLAAVCVMPCTAAALPKSQPLAAELVEASPRIEPPTKQTVVEVSILHATREGKGKDSRIGEMPELKEAPFSSYDSYELLLRSQLKLVKGAGRKLSLPNGRLLEARLAEVLPDTWIRLVASINRPGGSDFLPLLEVKARPGQSFIVAGQNYKRGMLVLVFKVLR